MGKIYTKWWGKHYDSNRQTYEQPVQGKDNTQNIEKIKNAKLNNNEVLTFVFLNEQFLFNGRIIVFEITENRVILVFSYLAGG